MSFVTPRGTQGARQPGRGTGLLNRLVLRRFARSTGTVMGMNGLVLTTVGRRTGQPRRTPVGWFPGPAGTWLIVAAAAGAPNHPAWYYNLAAHPDEATVETGGRTVAVSAVELHGAERDEAWARIAATAPRFEAYQQGTDRVLPVIRLTARR